MPLAFSGSMSTMPSARRVMAPVWSRVTQAAESQCEQVTGTWSTLTCGYCPRSISLTFIQSMPLIG